MSPRTMLPAEMDALDKAVEEARKVMENPDASRGDPNKGLEALNKPLRAKRKREPTSPLPAGQPWPYYRSYRTGPATVIRGGTAQYAALVSGTGNSHLQK